MSGSEHVVERLSALHDSYVDRINSVLEQGREDLAMDLSDTYTDEALRIITTDAA
jgi:hypothetical protein